MVSLSIMYRGFKHFTVDVYVAFAGGAYAAITSVGATNQFTKSCLMSSTLGLFGLFNSFFTPGIFNMMFDQDMDRDRPNECCLSLNMDTVLLHHIDMLLSMPSAISNFGVVMMLF